MKIGKGYVIVGVVGDVSFNGGCIGECVNHMCGSECWVGVEMLWWS